MPGIFILRWKILEHIRSFRARGSQEGEAERQGIIGREEVRYRLKINMELLTSIKRLHFL